MDREEVAKQFVKEYEELCKKYKMRFDLFDMWDVGNETIEVFDEQEGKFILLD